MLDQKQPFNEIVIRFAGDSGDGVQLIGEQFTLTAALSQLKVSTLPDFPAEIRAPQGTIAGVSGFQVAMSSDVLFTAGEEIDVLVAFNPAAFVKARGFLKSGSILILNQDQLTDKDWARAQTSPESLNALQDDVQILMVPIISETQAALADLNLSHSEAKKAKNFYALGIVLWLFELDRTPTQDMLKHKFKHQPDLLEANTKALNAGYHYACTLSLQKRNVCTQNTTQQLPPGEYRQITGTDAVALAMATLATATDTPCLVSGYPITPSSGILQACALLQSYGVSLFQAEDEISAIGAALGAAFGGALALTATSGPGFDLKTESLGLAIVSELPLVVIDVQRAGASTGLPTKTGQSDLEQALYGRHGESPLPVLSAISPADCFQAVIEAFCIAVRFMTPVVLLLDAYLVNAAEPWQIPDVDQIELPNIQYHQEKAPFKRNDDLSRSWNIPGKPGYIHQLGGLEKSGDTGEVNYDPENHEQMVALRAEKIAGIAKTYPPLKIEGDSSAQMILISWGSTYGSLKEIIRYLSDQSIAVAHVHLKHLFPLPQDLENILKSYQSVYVLELNQGHLCRLIRAEYGIDAKSLGCVTGQPFSTSKVAKTLQQEFIDGCL